MTDTVPSLVAEIIAPVYLVGGAVRDTMLGNAPHDHDFATPLLPTEIEERVRAAGRKPYLVGQKFGTVGFKVMVDGGAWRYVEVTTFRAEHYHDGSRKPDVTYVRDITADLSRRDFTINAMAVRCDGKHAGVIIDPFGGAEDLECRVLCAVGTPSHRFKEDPLRMLRLARFASQFGFDVDETTMKHARENAHKILTVSKERWTQEMDKLLVGEFVYWGLDVLERTQVLNFVLPELAVQVGYDQNTPHHDFTLWKHTKSVVAALPADPVLRWAGLLHDVGKPFVRTERPDRSNYVKHDLVGAEIAAKTAAYLKWSKERTQTVAGLVRDHLKEDSPLKEADSGAQKLLRPTPHPECGGERLLSDPRLAGPPNEVFKCGSGKTRPGSDPTPPPHNEPATTVIS